MRIFRELAVRLKTEFVLNWLFAKKLLLRGGVKNKLNPCLRKTLLYVGTRQR